MLKGLSRIKLNDVSPIGIVLINDDQILNIFL